MLKAISKQKDVDRLVAYIQHDGYGDNPIELSPEEELKQTRIAYCDKLRREGYPNKKVVELLQQQFVNPDTGRAISRDTAYRITRECEYVYSQLGSSPKEYAKAMAEEYILAVYRKAMATGNLKVADSAIKQYINLHQLNAKEGDTVPPDALERHSIYFVMDPTAVGLKMLSKDEQDAFYLKMTAEAAPKTIEITATDVTNR